MIYVSPVNNHAILITQIVLPVGSCKQYQLLAAEEGTDRRYALVKETYDLKEALEWLGIRVYDYKSIVQIEEAG